MQFLRSIRSEPQNTDLALSGDTRQAWPGITTAAAVSCVRGGKN